MIIATDKEKELLDMFYCTDCSRTEQAFRLKCSTASIRSRLKHCRERNGIFETSHLIAVYYHDKKT